MPTNRVNTKRSELVVVIILVIAIGGSLAFMPGTAVADDEWADDCETAQSVEAGSYSGVLTPNDEDWFVVDIPEGEYVTGNLSARTPGEDTELQLHIRPSQAAALTAADGSSLGPAGVFSDPGVLQHASDNRFDMTDGTVQFRIYAEATEPVCVRLQTEGDAAGEWLFSFTPSDGNLPVVQSESANDTPNMSNIIWTTGSEARLEIHSTADNDEFSYRFIVNGSVEKTQIGENGIAADADDAVIENDNGTTLVRGTTGDAAGDAFIIRGDIISSQVTGSDEVRIRKIEDITEPFVNSTG